MGRISHLVVDECHHLLASSYGSIFASLRASPSLRYCLGAYRYVPLLTYASIFASLRASPSLNYYCGAYRYVPLLTRGLLAVD